MPLIVDIAVRKDDGTGKDFLIFRDGSTRFAQGMALVDGDGAHAGVSENPVRTALPDSDWEHPQNASFTNDILIRNQATTLREIKCILKPGEPAAYLMLFDAAGAASGNPKSATLIPAGGSVEVTPPPKEATYATAIRAGVSSDPESFVSAGAVALFKAEGRD